MHGKTLKIEIVADDCIVYHLCGGSISFLLHDGLFCLMKIEKQGKSPNLTSQIEFCLVFH